MNNIAFNGRKEVIYGLKQAAASARATANCQAASFGPRPINRSSMEGVNKARMGAYLDMVIQDSAFTKTISNIKNNELKTLSNMLKPEKVQYGIINPLEIFKEAFTEICNKKNCAKATFEDFLKKI